MKQELIDLFMGILSGDGDIFGRMASSHADAKPCYRPPLDKYVERLNRDFAAGKYSKLLPDECLELATIWADEVLKTWNEQ